MEVGCGDGRSLNNIFSVTQNLVGVDYDPKAVKDAKKNFKEFPKVRILEADAKNLPFKDEEFDFVICMTTFANFGPHKYKALEEMKRVLKNTGNIIISVFNENALETRLKVYKKFGQKLRSINNGKIIFEERGDNWSEQFSRQELEGIFEKVGLNINEIIKPKIAYICKLSKK